VSEADDVIAAAARGGDHGRYGAIRACRWQRLGAVYGHALAPLALTGHDDTDDASSGHAGGHKAPRSHCVEGPITAHISCHLLFVMRQCDYYSPVLPDRGRGSNKITGLRGTRVLIDRPELPEPARRPLLRSELIYLLVTWKSNSRPRLPRTLGYLLSTPDPAHFQSTPADTDRSGTYSAHRAGLTSDRIGVIRPTSRRAGAGSGSGLNEPSTGPGPQFPPILLALFTDRTAAGSCLPPGPRQGFLPSSTPNLNLSCYLAGCSEHGLDPLAAHVRTLSCKSGECRRSVVSSPPRWPGRSR